MRKWSHSDSIHGVVSMPWMRGKGIKAAEPKLLFNQLFYGSEENWILQKYHIAENHLNKNEQG